MPNSRYYYHNSFDSKEELREFIVTNCRPYLSEVRFDGDWRNIPLTYRGVSAKILADISNAAMVRGRTHRNSVTTVPGPNEETNRIIAAAGRVANRSNCIFVSNTADHAAEFGDTVTIVFPIGDFNYTWFPHACDAGGGWGIYKAVTSASPEKYATMMYDTIEAAYDRGTLMDLAEGAFDNYQDDWDRDLLQELIDEGDEARARMYVTEMMMYADVEYVFKAAQSYDIPMAKELLQVKGDDNSLREAIASDTSMCEIGGREIMFKCDQVLVVDYHFWYRAT